MRSYWLVIHSHGLAIRSLELENPSSRIAIRSLDFNNLLSLIAIRSLDNWYAIRRMAVH